MSITDQAEALFARHLDLRPLGRRRRGNVRCRFHADRTASLSLDLERGLFHCFGCGVQGGTRRFAELVGEVAERPRATSSKATTREHLRSLIRDQALGQKWALPGVLALYELSDHLRHWRRFIAAARHNAMETSASWELLDLTARIEREAGALELYLDEYAGACA